MTVRDAGINNDPPAIIASTGLEFKITDAKMYVPVATFHLSTENNNRIKEL